MKLVSADEKSVIIEFHRADYFAKKRKARLEVQPAGMGMLDHIVFVENKRKDREAEAWKPFPAHPRNGIL